MSNSSNQIAEIKLSYKNNPDISDRPIVTQSKDAYAVLLQAWDMDQIGFIEQAKLLLLNQANRVLGICDLSTGGVTGTVCDPKVIFAAALKANACNLILAHNHPSESVAPSRADKLLTDKIKEAGQTLDITVLDHLVISPTCYYSFSDDATYQRRDLHLDMDKKDIAKEPEQTGAAEEQFAPAMSKPVSVAVIQKEFIDRALTRSNMAYDALLATWQENTLDIQQSFQMFCLDKDCQILRVHHLPKDMWFDACQDAQYLVSLAMKDDASFIVLAQNKPYGVIMPKLADLDFAEMLNAAGKDHDITLLDYLFVNKNGYYSYNDNEFHLVSTLQPVDDLDVWL